MTSLTRQEGVWQKVRLPNKGIHAQRRPEAEQDRIEIYLYVSRDNPAGAEELARALNAKCERLAHSPMIGRARPDLRPNLRSFPFGTYLILYRAIADGAEIVRVVHAARNLDDLV